MFDGKFKGSRIVSAAGKRSASGTDKNALLDNARKQREERLIERKRQHACIKIQSFYRQLSTQRKEFHKLCHDIDKKLLDINRIETAFQSRGTTFNVPLDVLLPMVKSCTFTFRPSRKGSKDYDSVLMRAATLFPFFLRSFTHNDSQFNSLHKCNEHGSWEYQILQVYCIAAGFVETHVTHMTTSNTAVSCGQTAVHQISVQMLQALVTTTQTSASNIAKYIADKVMRALRLLLVSDKTVSGTKELMELLLMVIVLAVRTEGDSTSKYRAIRSNQELMKSLITRVLTIPNLRTHATTITPLLQLLAADGAKGWLSALDVCAAVGSSSSSPGIIAVNGISAGDASSSMMIDKLNFLSNFCHCALSYSSDGSVSPESVRLLIKGSGDGGSSGGGGNGKGWISVVCDALDAMPLLSLMSFIESHCGDSDWTTKHISTSVGGGPGQSTKRGVDEIDSDVDVMDLIMTTDVDIQEQAFAMAGGLKRLEYRLTALQNRIKTMEKNSSTPCIRGSGSSKYEGMKTIIRVLSASHIVSSLTDVVPIVTTMPSSSSSVKISTVDSCSMNLDVLSSTFSVMNAYRKTLMSCPLGVALSTAHNVSSATLSLSLLNTMAFARPNQSLTKRLWVLLTATSAPFDVALLTEIFTSDIQIPTAAGASLFATNAFGSSSNSSFGGYGPLTTRAADQIHLTPAALREGVLSCMYILCCTMAHQMAATDDEEFFEQGKILPLEDIKSLVKLLKLWLYKLYWTHPLFDGYSDFKDNTAMPSLHDLQIQIAVTRLFNLLFTRNERRPYLPDDAWHFKGIARLDADAVSDVLMNNEFNSMSMAGIGDGASSSASSSSSHRSSSTALHQLRTLLSCIPQVIPFDQRVDVFQALLRIDKERFFSSDPRGGGMMAAMGMGGSVRFSVKRDTLVEDAFVGLKMAGNRLKGRVQVEFVGEAGIDGGGLFKEFIDSFLKAAFDPALGLFSQTSGQLLVPNSASSHSAYALCFAVSEMDGSMSYETGEDGELRPVCGHTHLGFFHFLGKMLGKALYESILVEPQFSSVFLNLLLDRRNQLDDLQDLDDAMHRSLMTMKHAAARGEDIASWGLFFEVERMCDGRMVSEDLIPNGSQIPVTRDNVHAFIHRKANYKLNIETAEQSRAFLGGFREMIPVDWMRMFGSRELQLLISGDKRPIDVADMRRHVNYAGGYADSQPYIQHFWDVVSSMNPTEQGELLQFVTSCPRQPLRGFGQLNPLICIQKVPQHSDESIPHSITGPSAARLPSAATCMNLLKLPQYDTIEQLRDKLLYAIKSHSGFELS